MILRFFSFHFPRSVFFQVQSVFGHLMDSKLQYFAPEQFWKCFKLWGQPVNVREQQVSPLNSIKLVITKVYGMRRQRSKVKRFCSNAVSALRRCLVTYGQNTRDQITMGRTAKRASPNCVLCIPFILSGSPNNCWLHTCDACVITTWRIGLLLSTAIKLNT